MKRQSYWSHRASRRQVLGWGAMGIAGASYLVACGNDDDASPTPGPGGETLEPTPDDGGEARTGGRLRLPWHTADAHLDPHISTEHLSAELWRAASHGLLKQQVATMLPEADLATGWETPDELTYVFTLTPEARWQNTDPVNGREVTAEDVVFSLERISTPGPDRPRASAFSAIDSFEVTDERTVTVRMQEPNVAILTPLSDKWTVIVPPEVVEQRGDLRLGDSIIGCGPFICQQADSSTGARLARNPDYWKDGVPHLDEVEYHTVTEEEARYAAFRAGEVDAMGGIVGGLPPLLLDSFRLSGVQITDYVPESLVLSLIGGPNDQPPLNDERVRRAINLAIDRDAMANVAIPGATYEPALFLPSPYWGLPPDQVVQIPGYGPKRDEELQEARDLLSAADADGTELEIITTSAYAVHHLDRAEALVPMFEAVGLRLKLEVMEFGIFKEREAARNFQLTAASYAAYGDPDIPMTVQFTSEGTRNYWKWSDEQYDELVRRQRREPDVEARQQLIREAQVYMSEGTPVASNTWYSTAYAGNWERVHNFQPNSSCLGWFLADMWVDA